MTILSRLEAAGLEIELNGEDLRVRAKKLTDEQVGFLRRNKEAIKSELAGREHRLSEIAKARLHRVINKLVNDCVAWYCQDN